MTAPREPHRPPAPPDRLPSPRGGHPSSQTASAAAQPAGFARLAGARRGLVRSARALAAAALLALVGGLALPATAQAQAQVLVSNLDKFSSVADGVFSSQSLAQGFRTGDDSSGYTVSSVQVKFQRALTPAIGSGLTVTLQTSSSSAPSGTVLATLSNPSSYPAGTITFNAAGNVRLEEGKNYFVVFEYPASISFGFPALESTALDGEDNVGDSEWSIRNAFHEIDPTDSSSAWQPDSNSNAILIRVNGVSGVVDLVAPRLTSARVGSDGASVRMIFDEDLSDELPLISAFTITAGGLPVPFSTVLIPASNPLALDLYNPSHLIGQGETVTVEYTDPTTGDDANAIQDTAGNDASSFVDRDVSNLSTITVPTLSAAAVPADGATVALTFSADLDFPTAFSSVIRGAFTVTVDGTESQTTDFAVSGATATLTMSDPIVENLAVIVSYDRSDAGSEAFGSSSTRLVANFTTGENSVPAVVNNSEVDITPPELTGATVASSGVAIELAFDEDLDLPATIPAALKDAFSVTADGDTVEIAGLAKDGSSGLQIALWSRILKDQAVVVRYDRSAAGTNALDDDAGNEVVDFTTGASGVPAVDNDSTQLSADATLSGLIFSVRNLASTALEAVDLSPAFDPGIETYSASVRYNKSQVTFMPETNDGGATVAYFDGDDTALEDAGTGTSAIAQGHQVDTAVGPNTVKVKVTAPDGMTEKTYTVTVTRELPTLLSASVQADGTSVSLHWESDFPSGTGTLSAAAVAAFTVTADGVERQITGIAEGISESLLDVTLSIPIYKDQAVVVSYDSAAGLADRYGNKYQSFTTGEDGVITALNFSTVLRTAPGKPTGLEASASGDARIDLSWTAPASDGGSAITGYKIEVSTDGGTNWTDLVADTGNDDTRYSHTGLSPGSTRHYRVSAINAVGTSDASDVVSDTTATSCTLNSGDRWCGVVTVGNRESAVYGFLPPVITLPGVGNLSDKTFDGYTIDGVWTGTGANAGKLFFDLTSARALSAADKARLVLHVGRVSFAFSAATGPSLFNTYDWEDTGLDWSSDSYVTLRLRLGVPGQPTNLAAAASGTTQIDLTWDAPGSGGSAITGYRIEVSENGGTDWDDLVADTGNTDTSYSHTGLSPGDTRHYRVSAINAGGTSEASDSDDATTIDPPTLSSAEVPGPGTSISLIFSENLDLQSQFLPTSVENAFTVTVDGVESEVESVVASLGDTLIISLSPKIYQGQTVTVSYDQSDAGTDALADSDGNELASFTTGEDGVPAVVNNSTQAASGPAAPTNFRATAGELQVALTWDVPASGSGVTRHEYQYKTSGEYLDDWKQIADSAPGEANESSFTVTGLTGGTAYTFQLRAVSVDGNSTAAEDGPVTPSAILTPPTIDDVAVTSTPLLNSSGGSTPDTYGEGETIEVSVTFNEPVTATTGTDFVLSVAAGAGAAGAKRAPLLRGSDTATLVFGYTVLADDEDTDGIWIGDQDGTLVGDRNSNLQNGTIASVATTVAADLTHSALGVLSGHKVDGSQRVTSTDATLSALVVTYGSSDVPLSPFFAPDTTAYTASVANAVAQVTVTPTTTHAAATIGYFDGDDVTLTDAGAAAGHQVAVVEGDNVIEMKVTAEDTTTTETYTVTVTRLAADAPGVEGQFRIAPDTVEGYSDDTLGRLNGHVGRAEVFHAERWGTVSDDGLLRTGNEASALVCQAMDYTTGEFASGYGQPGVPSQPFGLGTTKFYPVGSKYPKDGPLPIWLDDLSCVSGDTDLTGVNALKPPMAHCGYAGWGLHNSTHSEDAGVRCWNEPESDAGRSYDPLTAAFEGLPEAHDGETAFSFRLAFSEAVAVTPEAMRTRALTVAGGAVTGAARVDGESGVWEITVTPDSREDLSITLAPAEDCEAEGAVCTSDGRTLSAVPAHIVPGPGPETEPALTASFEGLPEVHDGEEGFHFRVAFSEEIGIGFRSMRDDSFTVDGGEVTAARRVDGRHDLWRITVEPDSDEDVAIALPGGRECAVSGAICTRGENRRQLANTPTATVAGPPERNTAATGAPAISGTVQVGEALTASTSGISDADGLDDASFGYQWMRADADIGGATGSTYTPVAADEGERLKVRVSFTDDAGNEESLTSAATDAVTAAPELNTAAAGAPAIGGTAQVGEALTASTSGISDADGLDDARFAYQWIRTDTDIGGATGSTYTVVDADEGERLKVRVDFTDDAGNAERLTSAATDAVAAAPEPLTASFEGMPAEHAGQGSFSFRVAFSEGIDVSYKTVRDASFTVTGGDVTRARRVDKRRDLWKITIEPNSDGAVTVRLPETTDCGASGAICTGDGRPLSHALSATVAGPVGIAVADARVEEGADAVLAFAVTLSRAASAALTVDYATADGSAHAGDDYRAASGTLTFGAGESSKTIEVAVLDDAHDEGEETLTLRLSNPSGGRLADGEATGTIENHDPMPRALLARFGRTAAVHVVEHVEERLAAPREPGFRGRFAGRELRRGMERDIALNFLRQLGGTAGAGPLGAGGPLSGAPAAGAAPLGMPGPAGGGAHLAAAGPMGGAALMGGASGAMGMAAGPMGGPAGPDSRFDGGGLLRMGLGGGDVLTGSDFALGRETGHGGILSFWSRGAQSRFSGREGALSLGGDVRTTMFGADYAKGPVVTGLSLSHSRGLGEYAGVAGGRVASSVTGLYPWLGYQATERVTVWGVAGYGAGGLRLTPQGGPALESGLSMAMAAAGTRGELVAGGSGGFALAFKADALWVGTSIDGVDGAAGRMAATAAAVTRFRTGLEGSRDYTLAGRLSLTPSVEVGLRHDGGDAETGAGMDVGGGLVVSDASTGLAIDVRVRMLVMHQAEGFRERGMAVSLSYNPRPSTPLGFVARVAPSWGGQATSGAEALWGQETMGGLAHGSLASGNRLDGEVGYGLPVGSRFVGTPTLGVGTSADGRDYRLGYRLGALGGAGTAFELGVDAQRRERPLQGDTDHSALARATLRW